MKIFLLVANIFFALSAGAAFSQNTVDTVQRDVNQQNRIENGLKDDSLNTNEAGRLEREKPKLTACRQRT
jgi:hypothetical protein